MKKELLHHKKRIADFGVLREKISILFNWASAPITDHEFGCRPSKNRRKRLRSGSSSYRSLISWLNTMRVSDIEMLMRCPDGPLRNKRNVRPALSIMWHRPVFGKIPKSIGHQFNQSGRKVWKPTQQTIASHSFWTK